MVPQNLGQRYNIGGLVRKKHFAGVAVPVYQAVAAATGMGIAAATEYSKSGDPEIYNLQN